MPNTILALNRNHLLLLEMHYLRLLWPDVMNCRKKQLRLINVSLSKVCLFMFLLLWALAVLRPVAIYATISAPPFTAYVECPLK
jgi:hypothetical protein